MHMKKLINQVVYGVSGKGNVQSVTSWLQDIIHHQTLKLLMWNGKLIVGDLNTVTYLYLNFHEWKTYNFAQRLAENLQPVGRYFK